MSGSAANLVEAGVLVRQDGMERAGRGILKSLMRRAYVPHEARWDLDVVAGEALSNAHKYHQFAFENIDGGDVGYYLVASAGHLLMVFAYLTPWFDPDQKTAVQEALSQEALLALPPEVAESGRGIMLMKSLSDSILFRQDSGGLILAMEKRWAT